MLINILLALLGIALIIIGANWLTDGASAIATRFNVSDMVIGLTIVAFGTSAPELTISIISALNGNANMAVGNVIGSNIFNIVGIVGITAILCPLAISKRTRQVDIPIAIACAILLVLLLKTHNLHYEQGMGADLTRPEAVLLVIAGIAFIYFNIKRSNPKQTGVVKEAVPTEPPHHRQLWLSLLLLVIGLVALVFGGKIFVNASSKIALAFGISETVIGLTLVAWGTSLPELATSIVAAVKGRTDIAIGNAVGSNIFNILFVLGISGTITPMSGLNFSNIDLLMQLAVVVLMFLFALPGFSPGRINRVEGFVLVLILIGYNYLLLSHLTV